MSAPFEPDYSCPFFDAAIEQLEQARGIAEKLRQWGSWYENRANELEREKEEAIEERDKRIRELESEVEDLKAKLKQAESVVV